MKELKLDHLKKLAGGAGECGQAKGDAPAPAPTPAPSGGNCKSKSGCCS